MASARTVHLDDLERVPLDHGSWRPVRRTLGITAFGVNAYSADRFAAERDPAALAHAATDPDLDPIRDDPDFPR